MDRQHLPSHKPFADGELRFHTLRHTMVPSWETTLFFFFFFLMWLLLSVVVPKLRRLATRTILKHRCILQKPTGAQEERALPHCAWQRTKESTGLAWAKG